MKLNYRPPQNDDDFEEFCCELLKLHWKRPDLERYGRNGQRQFGIDIFDPKQKKPIRVAQAKCYNPLVSLAPKEIQTEVDQAKKSPLLPFKEFVILTSAKKSTDCDNKIAEINRHHRANGLFEVKLLTWVQIEHLLRTKFPSLITLLDTPATPQQTMEIVGKLDRIFAVVDTPASGVSR